MTDDRAYDVRLEYLLHALRGESRSVFEVMQRAADEIERLQVEVELWKDRWQAADQALQSDSKRTGEGE